MQKLTEMSRCNHCWKKPTVTFTDGSWTIMCCGVIAFSLGDAEANYTRDNLVNNYERAVSRWNDRQSAIKGARVA